MRNAHLSYRSTIHEVYFLILSDFDDFFFVVQVMKRFVRSQKKKVAPFLPRILTKPTKQTIVTSSCRKSTKIVATQLQHVSLGDVVVTEAHVLGE